MLEIYNEAINDLLYEGKPETAPKHEVKLVKEGSKEVRGRRRAEAGGVISTVNPSSV